jgi:hypothetical protein
MTGQLRTNHQFQATDQHVANKKEPARSYSQFLLKQNAFCVWLFLLPPILVKAPKPLEQGFRGIYWEWEGEVWLLLGKSIKAGSSALTTGSLTV